MRCRSLAATVICLGTLLGATPVRARQAPSLEGDVKAAFLFNFAQFIDWPKEAFAGADAPFTICVTGDALVGPLEKTVEGEMLNGRPIVLRRMAPPDNVAGCHLVYVGRQEGRRSMEILSAAAGMPIVTVGDSAEFIDQGGMIRFTEVAHRIRFEINPDAASRSALRVSSRLLRLADIVRPRPRAGTP